MAGEADTPKDRATPIAAKALRAMKQPQPQAQAAPPDSSTNVTWTPPPGTQVEGAGPPHLADANAGAFNLPDPTAPPGAPTQAVNMPTANPIMHDPLARPYDLPSGGVFYGKYGYHKTVTMVPTRGEQENVIAGAGEDPQSQLAVLRGVMQQCVDLGPIPYDELVLYDWTALVINWLAYCNGTDIIGIRPQHGKCRPITVTFSMSELPCKVLRFAQAGEVANWPPAVPGEEVDDIEAIIMEMEREEGAKGVEEFLLTRDDSEGRFVTGPLPLTGERVTWRLPVVADMVTADDFASRIGSTDTSKGKPLHTFLLALQILAIDGRPVGRLEAMRWASRAATPTLDGFREHTSRRSWGYDTRPSFRCHCGAQFRVRLPLDGAMFRRRPSGS